MNIICRKLILLLLAVCCAFAAPFAVAAQTKKPVLSDVQRKEIQEVIAQFRKLRGQQEQRLAAIEQMQKLGPSGLAQLLDIIQKESGKPIGEYRLAFFRAAASEGAKKLNESNLSEIAKLRGDVLSLSKQPELKKEDIIRVGDPGLARLKELILFSREDVLTKHPELLKRRDALQPLGRQWEKCAELLMIAEAQEEERERSDKADKEKEPDAPQAEVNAAPERESPNSDESLDFPSFEKYLLKEEEIAAALAMPMDERTRTTFAANGQITSKLDAEEARCVLDLNLTRALLGLRALRMDAPLTAAARDHSTDMEKLKFFSHESPVSGKKTPGDRAQRFGSSYSAENIAVGTIDGTAANQMWWHSPGHHKNMLGSHGRVGVGRSGIYWTEMFGN